MSLGTMVRMSAVMVLAGAAAGCGGGAEAPPEAGDGAPPAAAAGAEGMQGMHGMGAMHADPAMMRRHAEEMDSTVAEMRRHLEEMRRLGPEQWHARMGEHAPRAGRMLGTLERQVREMDMGMGMSDEAMGAMMGMDGAGHRRMMEEMRALRAELGELQTASREELRERMPRHLDRIEGMLSAMERSAEHMRGS